MAASKKSLTCFFFVSIMIMLSFFSGSRVEGNYLGYGAIAKDRIPACGSKNPKECVKELVNPYRRGCQDSTRCHRDV
ncbi:hypothetical protein CARUB_v10021631mg [Capsella rubella]|uniref:Uncharacterized protein n=1 Tax=Capsella rubella TaxID=81985 RepID=R0I7R6_9BRAS|nr:protein RALF-like 6 [Capsella rubella]EOA34130.1 hypothetical protein CARUB_v10021631mg [Capsella rubella]